MRICMLSYYYWPTPAGGAESQCRKLSAALVACGHECTVLTIRQVWADPPRQLEESGVRIVRLPIVETLLNGRRTSVQVLGQTKHLHASVSAPQQQANQTAGTFKKFLEFLLKYSNSLAFIIGTLCYIGLCRKKIDILHVHTAEWVAGLAAWAGNIFHFPVVCKGSNIPVFPQRQGVPFASFFDAWRRKPHFIALTPAMSDDLLNNGVPANRISIIPNGVELPNRIVAVKDNKNFLYIGNFSQSAAHKGFDVLIEAWAAFHRLRPEPRLIMLGGGDASPWRCLAEQLGGTKSIEFVGYQADIVPYFLQACCLLLPSRKEGISNALLEAQSWGIPAIVSDIPANQEVVEHERNGLIVPVGDSKALAAAMLRCCDEPDFRRRCGAAARRRMEEVFAMDTVAARTLELYQQLRT
ncbi:MAG: glycosyltransferase family 4 protein [Candidatus Electronema sp. V4]|uniref:glycosyltransferase family 4 protein n=1 Tax=Candidatus Electronema sp. V4 TaxID=3454756 RepID=UPI0040557966